MDKGYYEFLVQGKPNTGAKIGKVVLLILCIAGVGLGLLTGITILLVIGVACGVGVWLCSMYTDVEYEYLFIERELSIDKVYNKERRKHAETLSMDKVEVFAPEKSSKLDNFGNGQGKKVTDYSSADVQNGFKKYVMYYEGNRKILFSLNEEIAKYLRGKYPRTFSEY